MTSSGFSGRRLAAAAAILALIPLGAASCVLGNIDHADCTSNDECATAFGAGATCEQGFCVDAPALDPRCRIIGSEDADVIEFGAILPRTDADGVPHEWGPFWEDSIELAIGELNPPFRTGINGRPLRFTSCNTSGDAAQATELANHLVGRKVPAILSDGSTETLADAAVTTPAGVLLLAGASTTPELTTLPDDSPFDKSVGLVWRTTPSDTYQAQVLAKQIEERFGEPYPTVGVFERDDSFGQGLTTAFQMAYHGKSNGYLYEVVVAGEPDTTGQTIQKVAAAKPPVVVLIGFPADVTAILNGTNGNSAFDAVDWYFTQGGKFPTLFTDVTNAARFEGSYGTALATPDPSQSQAFAWFQPQFENKYATSTDSVADIANVFDAAMLLAAMAQYALGPGGGTLDGTTMARGLALMSAHGGDSVPLDPPHFGQLSGDITARKPINVEGASGHLDFDAKTGEAKADIEVWKIQDGDFLHVKNVTP